jgi:Prion-inhibition and propagation
MAEPFGIVAAAVGIAAAFTTCVDCFEYIQLGRHFGRDFQTNLLTLNCARLRLTRWGQAVNIYNDPQLGNPNASPAETQTAKDTLIQILVLFANTEKISNKYKLGPNAGVLSVYSTTDMDPTLLALNNKMRDLAIKRQKGTGLLKKTSWALYHNSEFRKLIEDITRLIENLENLFPAPAPQLELVKQEAAEVNDKQELQLVENAAEGVDKLLQAAVKEARTGHQYLNVVVIGQAKALNGDTFGSDWKAPAIGVSHIYNGVRVEGNAKVLNGNKYGGKDFFDD